MSVSLNALANHGLGITRDLIVAIYQEAKENPKSFAIATAALMIANYISDDSRRKEWDPFTRGFVFGATVAALSNVSRKCGERFHSLRKLH